MNIESYEIWNFKSIKYSGKIKLPRLTIFIGPNNSGKTNLIQPLLMLKQTYEREEPNIPLIFNGPDIKLGAFKSFIRNKNESLPFEVKFNFTNYKKENIFNKSDKQYKCPICRKEYKLVSWYKKHLKDKHPDAFKNKKELLLDKKLYKPKKPSIKISYKFDEKSNLIYISELIINNPKPIKGLNISNIVISQNNNKLNIKVEKYSGNTILDFNLKNYSEKKLIDPRYINRLFGDYYYYYRYHYDSEINDKLFLIEQNYGKYLEKILNKYEDIEKENNILNINKIIYDNRDIYKDNKEILLATILWEKLSALISNTFNYCFNDIVRFLSEIHHIGPLRNKPERIYSSTGRSPKSVGVKGEYTHELFWSEERTGNKELFEQLNKWLSKINIDSKIAINKTNVGEIYQLIVKENGLSINLADSGFGLSQILPIITECIYFRLKKVNKRYDLRIYLRKKEDVDRVLFIEQPEVHLNPKIQSALGDLFDKIAKPNRRIVIETHSEHLITRLQRRIVENKLKPEDLILYYINKTNNISEVDKIKVNNKGEFSYWPEGFFQDDFEDSIEILKASLKIGQSEKNGD